MTVQNVDPFSGCVADNPCDVGPRAILRQSIFVPARIANLNAQLVLTVFPGNRQQRPPLTREQGNADRYPTVEATRVVGNVASARARSLTITMFHEAENGSDARRNAAVKLAGSLLTIAMGRISRLV